MILFLFFSSEIFSARFSESAFPAPVPVGVDLFENF